MRNILSAKQNTENTPQNAENGTPGSVAAAVAQVIHGLEERLGGKVEMVNSPDEVTNAAARRRIEGDRRRGKNTIKGWYDPKTGKVYIYMPNVTDADDAVRTVLHELKGHKGLDATFFLHSPQVVRFESDKSVPSGKESPSS